MKRNKKGKLVVDKQLLLDTVDWVNSQTYEGRQRFYKGQWDWYVEQMNRALTKVKKVDR